MSWPTPQDYNEAVQNPRLNFEDADLRAGTPDVTPLGLPRPITGGFASVYSIRNGSKRWAVRCFLRDFADHKERYAEIGRHLAAARLPYTVDFQFLEKGIRVRGRWYPVLKMEWIEGSTFHEIIEKNIQSPNILANLAERWLKMLAALKKHGIAHGDLQHGNVLIAGGDFRLIDYDGMFVPSFAGKASHEVGHRNYQHPARTESDFGAHVDNFSGWVIYLTLMAISIDPGLWSRYGGDQEHLLFQKEDFDGPRFSRVLRSLQQLPDDRIQKYLPLFVSFLGMRLSSIASPAGLVGAPLKKRATQQVPLPLWSRQSQLDLFAPAQKPPVPVIPDIPAAAPPVVIAEPSIIDEPVAIEPFELPRRVLYERILVAAYSTFIATLIGLAVRGVLQGREAAVVVLAGLVVTTVCFLISYLALDEVRAKFVLWFCMELRRNRTSAVRYAVARMGLWMSGIELKESQELMGFATRDFDNIRREQDRIAEVKRILGLRIDDLEARIKGLDLAEAEDAAQLLQRLQAKHDALLSEGSFLANLRRDELRGRDLKTFVKWRTFVDDLAKAGPPQAISSAERLRIQNKYDLERRIIRRSESLARRKARKKILGIRRTRDRKHAQLELKCAGVCRRFERRKGRLQRVIDRGTGLIGIYRVESARDRAAMIRYQDIRFSKYLLRIFGMW